MTASKFHWWQYSLQRFIVYIALLSVLSFVFWSYRDWGRRLQLRREQLEYSIEFHSGTYQHWPGLGYVQIPEVSTDAELARFDRQYWLPLKVYEMTKCLDQTNGTEGRDINIIESEGTFRFVPESNNNE